MRSAERRVAAKNTVDTSKVKVKKRAAVTAGAAPLSRSNADLVPSDLGLGTVSNYPGVIGPIWA